MKAVELINTYIDEQGITQSKLAELSGLSFSTINRILNDKQDLKPNTLAKIADALSLPVSHFIEDDTVKGIEAEVQGYIEYNGEIRKIKSFTDLQKIVGLVEYETKVLPKEAKDIITINKKNKANIKKNKLNAQYPFRLDWESVDDYDAAQFDCWGFKTGNEEKDGIVLDIGNQCSGYPFSFHGHTFYTSESAYLCGQFSMNIEECKRIQFQLLYERNGYNAKKKIKNANLSLIRTDWDEFRAEWMLYVIWSKCIGNSAFADKLRSIPRNAIIIENSTTVYEGTNVFWGSINKDLEDARNKVARYTELQYMKRVRQGKIKKNMAELNAEIQAARNDIHYIGTFKGGHNFMGKILKRCQLALLNDTEPTIDYRLLRKKQIYLLGELLTFD